VKLARPPPSPSGGGRRRRGSTASPYPLKAAANAHVWSLRPPPPGTRRLRQVCTSPRVRDAVQSSALSRHSLKGGDSPHVGGLFGEHCSVVVERGCILHAQHVQPHLALRTSRDTGPAPPTLQPPTRRPCTKGTGHTPACPCTGSASVSPRRVLSRTPGGGPLELSAVEKVEEVSLSPTSLTAVAHTRSSDEARPPPLQPGAAAQQLRPITSGVRADRRGVSMHGLHRLTPYAARPPWGFNLRPTAEAKHVDILSEPPTSPHHVQYIASRRSCRRVWTQPRCGMPKDLPPPTQPLCDAELSGSCMPTQSLHY
jgi:hypothetical protein